MENHAHQLPLFVAGDVLDERAFEQFWAAYPRKVEKAEARAAWHRLAPSAQLVSRMMATLARQKASAWRARPEFYIPYPATWINGRRWRDLQRGV